MLIRDFIKPYWVTVTYIVILVFGQVIADLLLPDFMANIVDKGIANGDTGLIIRTGGIMLCVSLIGITCAVTGSLLASRTTLCVSRDLRKALFNHITKFSLGEFDRIGTSSLITRTTNDVQQIQITIFIMLRIMLRAPVMCIGGVIMAIRKDSELSLLLLAILPFVAGIIYLVTIKALPLFRMMQNKLDNLNLILRENLVGIRIIRAFSRLGFEKKKFAKANDELAETAVRVNRIMAVLNPAMVLCMNILMIAIVWTASSRIDLKDLSIGDMMAFIQYAMQIFMSMTSLTMLFVILPRAFTSAERLRAVFDLKAGIQNPENPINTEKNYGSVHFKNVSFRYDNAEICAVQDISFSAKPGETVAIIGGTGSGKTTLVNLILRYYDVESGSVEIDGIDIRRMKQEDLHRMIGFVPQKISLFSGTVEENVRIGKQTANMTEITDACRIAQAEEFIEDLPQKYKTEISQGGTNLSGGQRQRLSIARAIVKKPKIYIFDDSFSALDFKTEAAVRAELRKETEHAAVIIVAQRVSSIRHADRILVLDNGKIAGSGTHKELSHSNEVYREIMASQEAERELVKN